jgi:hypothetical protein
LSNYKFPQALRHRELKLCKKQNKRGQMKRVNQTVVVNKVIIYTTLWGKESFPTQIHEKIKTKTI